MITNLVVTGTFLLQLESLSREDLLKFVKRQMVNLQKLKQKNEGKTINILQWNSCLPDVP